ncbi:hypothetical protein [Bacillus alkalicellulosilyticus]|uniref:hypothetical protein n=1 Tax=Alkalihalobacterium alkalicellulosilyticum TaxID=1912214 RepID=UPI0009962D3A|nr:hypothetical protein [Bacillus alkalicellulosilyticus]
MKKNISLNLILHILFWVGTIITVVIIYKGIDTTFSSAFIIGYAIYLLLYFLFSIILVIANAKKVSTYQIKKRLYLFIAWFLWFSALKFLISHFSSSEMSVYDFAIPFGLAIGLAFSDLMIWKKKDEDRR